MKIEKIEKEIAKLESEIQVLNANRKKTNNATALREIDAKIHAKQKSIEAKRLLIKSLKAEKNKPAEVKVEEKLTFEIEEVAEIQQEPVQEEKKEEVKLEPKKVVRSEEEILLEEIAALEIDIEQLKLNKMKIRRQATIDEINEKIKQKDKQIAIKKNQLLMVKIVAKRKKQAEKTL